MIRQLAGGLLLCATLAACSSGGASVVRPASVSTPKPGAQRVTVSIKIPGAGNGQAAKTRGARYISVNTQSASISVNGATPVIVGLAASSPNCVAGPSGRTCTVSIDAPVGTDTFAEQLYASVDGSGPVLSENSVSAAIVAGTANTVNLTLDGVVASIALVLQNPTPPVGSPVTIPLTVNFYDASNAAIIGNAPFYNPITLTDSDTSGATKLSATQLASPGDASSLTVYYSGAPITSATFSATAAGVPASNVSPATLTPQNSGPAAFVDWPMYAFDSARDGFNPSSTAITPSTLPQLQLAWQITSQGSSLSQPIVATNIAGHQAIVIFGNFNGAEAVDATTGSVVWNTYLGTQNLNACGDNAPIAGSAAFDRALNAVYMVGGNGGSPSHVLLYRMDVTSGAITGKADVTPTFLNGEAVFAHTGVAFANGLMYFGIGSNCEGTTQGPPSWRGSVVAVDPGSMSVVGTFYPTYGQGGNVGGGGVWSYGAVSADASGNIYTATGNAETPDTVSQTPPPPFVLTTNEQFGYAEHLVKLSSNLSQVQDSDYPGFNFQIGYADLDYAGTPVVYQPPPQYNCGTLTATQGKGGTLVINSTQGLNPPLNSFALSVPTSNADYIGNPAYSPQTGLLYAPIASSGQGSSMLPPGMAAIGGCGSSITWHAQFGPDSEAYAASGPHPRSAPTVTAGGVVFMATPCTNNGNGGCGTPGVANGAVWAVDATTGSVLNGGNPIIVTPDMVLMAPTVDGSWMYVLDNSGNLYGFTIDPSALKIKPKAGRRIAPSFHIRAR